MSECSDNYIISSTCSQLLIKSHRYKHSLIALHLQCMCGERKVELTFIQGVTGGTDQTSGQRKEWTSLVSTYCTRFRDVILPSH